MSYKIGSLFAGVGGICQAFKNAGCEIAWANEIDEKACITYSLNYPSTTLIMEDVQKLTHEILEDIDILVAGFPCQPFSQAGHGKGFDDERGHLFFEVIRLLKDLQPKAFFLENVKTLASHNNGETFRIIKEELKSAGYSFIPFILNASEYTNIPQGRTRIYIVGFKNEAQYFFDTPIAINKLSEIQEELKSKLFKIPAKRNNNETLRSIKDFLDNTTVSPNDFYNNLENHIHQKVFAAVKNDNSVYQYRRYYVRENKSDVCPTLTANMGSGGHNVPIILDKKIPRRLTPKECFNLQGFPKDFQLPNNIGKSHLYKQAGNSVVIPMVQKIAEEIVRVLNNDNSSGSC